MRQIRVLLVEDHPVVLRGLRALVAEYEDFEVVGEAPTAEEAVAMACALRPDVTVLPVRLGGTHSGIELCCTIKSVSGARVVVFTSFTRTVDVQIAMLAGADALVSKTAASESFISALRQVTVGGQALVLGPGVEPASDARRFADAQGLTKQEDRILGFIIEGLTNQIIAERLSVEVSTVKTHVRSILRKLGVENRKDLFKQSDQYCNGSGVSGWPRRR